MDDGFVSNLTIKCFHMIIQMDIEQQIWFEILKILKARSIAAATNNLQMRKRCTKSLPGDETVYKLERSIQ